MKKHFQFSSVQYLNSDIKSVWEFASSPKNLKKITPDYMLFNITSENQDKMYPGMIISYQVAPILKLKLNWVTEITHVIENKFFVDEQKIGPYALWHHQHLFEVVDKRVKMIDIVTYKPPFGFIGRLANTLFIEKQIKSIFEYRRKKMHQLFNQNS
ncbi:MAG: SRPBCC family protein [Flavobacteriales bacterium]|nr:SRPBCC family protein [Flavobacteriales bacterium]